MSRVNNSLENSFMAGRCNCLSLTEEIDRLSGIEMANSTYRPYDADFNLKETMPVFDFEKTLFKNGMLTDDNCPLSVLHVQYDRSCSWNFDLQDVRRGTVPIYSSVHFNLKFHFEIFFRSLLTGIA